jgi:tol-pal system protein YbgF
MVSDMLKYLRNSVAAAVLIGACLGNPAWAQSASEIAVRMTQLEDQMRQLIGQVEELTFEVKQLKGKTDTGALEQAPQQPAKAKRLAAQVAPADPGIERIDGQPLVSEEETFVKSIIAEDGSEQQVVVKKAPGPKILGSLNGTGSATTADDGTFQGQVLVAPGQQEPGADAGVIGGNTDSIETVALAPESPETLYERSNESLLRRQFGDAEAGFRTFIEKYPDHSLAGSAQYWLGETFYAQSDFRQAAQAFLHGYRQYPDSRRAADSLFKLGVSLDRLGQKQQACAAYTSVSSDYPKAVEIRKRAQAAAKNAGCSA